MSDECMCCQYNSDWEIATKFPFFLFHQAFSIAKCPVCGLGKTIPAPKLENTFYENNIRYEDLFSEKSELYLSFAKELLTSFPEVKENPIGKRLLDIGCGGGFAVEYAAILGYKAEGIDANEKMVQWGQNKGLNVYKSDAMELSETKNGKFDIVLLSAVLEHLENPLELLRHIKCSLLKPAGIILVAQASYDGLLPKVFPWGWYGWQPKEHYWHFTPNSFKLLAERAEFSVIRTKRISLYHPWFLTKKPQELVGRNVSAVLARAGEKIGLGDNFYMLLKNITI